MFKLRNLFPVSVADFMTTMLAVVLLIIATVKLDAQHGNVTLKTAALITLTWPGQSNTDLDLWVKGPGNTVVGYPQKDGRYMHLDRDDLGHMSNTVTVNGQTLASPQNVENVSVNKLVPGEYVVDVHFYRGDVPTQPCNVTVVLLSPYRQIFSAPLTLTNQQESTAVSFTVGGDGTVSDIRTDIQIPIRRTLQ